MQRTHRLARPILGAALAVALLAAPARSAEMEKYLPDGTVFVLSLNVKNLLKSPLLRADEQAFRKAMGEAAKVLGDFGVNPEKDLDRVVLAAGQGMQPNAMLILLEGTFNTAKLEAQIGALARERKGNVEPAEGAPAGVYQVRLPQQARNNPGVPGKVLFTVLDRNFVAVAADPDALTAALAKKNGKKADVKREVLAEIAKINPKETASVVVVPPQEMLAGGPAAGMTKITGGVTVGEGVKTDLLLSTKDGTAAKDLAQAINDGLAQIKQFVPILAGQQPGVGKKEIDMITEVIDSFKASPQSNGVTIKGEITKEFIDKAKKNGGKTDK
jgi:hypothetical protein